MTLTASTSKTIIREAHKSFDRIQRTIEDYNIMVTDCRKQGYRPSHCIHGTYLWVDYDVMCPGCEDSYDPRNLTYMDVLKETLEEYRIISRRYLAELPNISKAHTSLVQSGLRDLADETFNKATSELLGRFTQH